MPRPPRILKPSRKIREALGLNQSEMGELLGVSRNTVVKLENGQMKMPRTLAYRYRTVTGCDLRVGEPSNEAEDILEVMPTMKGMPYTRDLYDAFCFAYRQPEFLEKVEEEMQIKVGLLLDRSQIAGVAKELAGSFAEFFSEMIRRYDLGEDLDAMFSNPLSVAQEDTNLDSGNSLLSIYKAHPVHKKRAQRVRVLKGDHAGKEGICLLPTDDEKWDVWFEDSDEVVSLVHDRDFSFVDAQDEVAGAG